ncbi:toll/interleukin-1 receptor domain-containing protein [Mucilaginibacter gilvus]|nr:toll/interleukin-1 receptor domain-containing protein [Mucilaginibacter gilvus]
MKVFISWSGETSRNIAEILRQWLPSVIQSVKPYYSPDDITKGTRWGSEIAKELDESKVGIICLTKDNLNSPWIMFEAGALSKNIDSSKVCPILFGIDPSDIQGPLVQFQAAKFNREEIKKVVRMINAELGDFALSSEVFESVFDMWWPRLSEKIEIELNKTKPSKSTDKGLRGERDLLEEILSLTRQMSFTRERADKSERVSPMAIRDLLKGLEMLVKNALEDEKTLLFENLQEFFPPMKYLIERTVANDSLAAEFKLRLEEVQTTVLRTTTKSYNGSILTRKAKFKTPSKESDDQELIA